MAVAFNKAEPPLRETLVSLISVPLSMLRPLSSIVLRNSTGYFLAKPAGWANVCPKTSIARLSLRKNSWLYSANASLSRIMTTWLMLIAWNLSALVGGNRRDMNGAAWGTPESVKLPSNASRLALTAPSVVMVELICMRSESGLQSKALMPWISRCASSTLSCAATGTMTKMLRLAKVRNCFAPYPYHVLLPSCHLRDADNEDSDAYPRHEVPGPESSQVVREGPRLVGFLGLMADDGT